MMMIGLYIKAANNYNIGFGSWTLHFPDEQWQQYQSASIGQKLHGILRWIGSPHCFSSMPASRWIGVCVCRIANPCCKYMLVCKCQASQTAPACCMAQQITNCCSHVANGVKYPVALRCLGPIGKKAYEWKLTVSSVEENSAHDNNMSSSEMNKTYLVHMMIALPVPTSPTMHGIGTVTPPCLPLFAGIGSPWIALRDHSHNQQTGIA